MADDSVDTKYPLMDREDFQAISRQRSAEANALLQAGLAPGAYYLAGYAVEAALKACIAKKTAMHSFPDKNFAQKCWTHNLRVLAGLAEVWQDLEQEMKDNVLLQTSWGVVKDWSEVRRYDLTIEQELAASFLDACNNPQNGILAWIMTRW